MQMLLTSKEGNSEESQGLLLAGLWESGVKAVGAPVCDFFWERADSGLCVDRVEPLEVPGEPAPEPSLTRGRSAGKRK